MHIDSIAINIHNVAAEEVSSDIKHEGLRWFV